MGFKFKDLIKPALTIGAGFVANKFLPGSGKFVGKAVGSLMGGGSGGGGGDWSPIDTSVQAQSYGGKLGFERADMAGKSDRMVGTSKFSASRIKNSVNAPNQINIRNGKIRMYSRR